MAVVPLKSKMVGRLYEPRFEPSIGAVAYADGSQIQLVGPGTSGYPLTGQGGGLAPAFQAISAGALPSGIDAAKIADGSVSNAEFQRLDGVTSAIQTQIDGKVPTTRTVNGHALNADVTVSKSDVGLGSADNTADSAKSVASAAVLTTARTIDGVSFNGSADVLVIAPGTHAATGKTTPVDADELPLVDSAASNVLKKLTWANLKATAKTYFDTLYQAILSAGTGIAISGSTISTRIDAHAFTSTGAFTWTKPAGVTFVRWRIFGGGGAGGAGRGTSGAGSAFGGAGGGGGALNEGFCLASDLGATVTGSVGAGGTGGTGVAGANGNDGTSGGNSWFGTHYAYGGKFGSGGTSGGVSNGGGGGGTQGPGGQGGDPTIGGPPGAITSGRVAFGGGGGCGAAAGNGSPAESGGGGAAGTNNNVGRRGGMSLNAGGGGASGGGSDGAGTTIAGGEGGLSGTDGTGTTFVGGGGSAGTGTGGNGASGSSNQGGSGGGGGGGVNGTTVTGYAGGNGGTPGGGGGGGGGARGSVAGTGGAGGNGGNGAVYVWAW